LTFTSLVKAVIKELVRHVILYHIIPFSLSF
jgi:hypothetical protein